MGKCAIIRFAACAAFVFAASETLQAAELSHRWSFNGDYSDSVGGAYAVKCGTYVSLYGGRVHMGYGDCTHGTGYVDLGTNISRIRFDGSGAFRSLVGEWAEKVRAFMIHIL